MGLTPRQRGGGGGGGTLDGHGHQIAAGDVFVEDLLHVVGMVAPGTKAGEVVHWGCRRVGGLRLQQ